MNQTDMATNNLRDDIKVLDGHMLYLCKHVAGCEARLKNIEDNMKINDINTDLYGKQISELKGKFMGATVFIAIIVSLIISVLI